MINIYNSIAIIFDQKVSIYDSIVYEKVGK